MSKKERITFIFILIISLVISISLYSLRLNQQKQSTPDLLSYYYSIFNNKNCSIDIAESIINVAHIKRIGDKFEISCNFTSLHEGLDYQNIENSSVFFGLIKNCDENAAKLIDAAVRSKLNCIFPMNKPIPDSLTDYYAVYFACSKYVNTMSPNPPPCYRKITNLENTLFYVGTIGVIDVDKGIFYR